MSCATAQHSSPPQPTLANPGQTARCQPAFSFYPACVEDLIHIIQFARRASKFGWRILVTISGVIDHPFVNDTLREIFLT
jgi:hypothetical protein